MGIARSTFYDDPTGAHDDTAIVEAIAAICDEFEAYGWRRVRAELRHRGDDRQSQEGPSVDARA
jgi:putative transposase